jgi:hypothetical protein
MKRDYRGYRKWLCLRAGIRRQGVGASKRQALGGVGRDAVSLEHDVTMVVHVSDLGVHPNVLPSVSVAVRVATTELVGSKMYYRYRCWNDTDTEAYPNGPLDLHTVSRSLIYITVLWHDGSSRQASPTSCSSTPQKNFTEAFSLSSTRSSSAVKLPVSVSRLSKWAPYLMQYQMY